MNFKKYLVIERRGFSGLQRIYRFENGFGASVIDGKILHSYSFYVEVAVIKFNSEKNDDFTIVYDTSITDDVNILNNDGELKQLLKRIKGMN